MKRVRLFWRVGAERDFPACCAHWLLLCAG